MKKVGKYEIPSVRACFAMLESLSHHPGGVLLSEIVEAGVLPLASAFRMAVVLENLGYVARDPETKRIRLTDKLLLLGQRALTERGLLEQSQGVLRALRDKVDGTVLIGVRDGASFVVLDQVIGSRMFCFVSKPGYRLELHCSAPGKAVWAFLPEDEREALFRQVKLTRYNVRTKATAAAVRADPDRRHLDDGPQDGHQAQPDPRDRQGRARRRREVVRTDGFSRCVISTTTRRGVER